MYLYYVHIESGGDVYPISIDLEGIKDRIASSLPKKHGASAPKYRVEFDQIEWITSKTCKIKFSQRYLGENADSILEINFDDPFHPKIVIASTVPQ
jgi:hypothetical protein